MQKNIALIYGDCSSPEIVTQAVRVLDKVAEKFGHTFTYTRAYMGGEAIDKFGDPLPQSELDRVDNKLLEEKYHPERGAALLKEMRGEA